MFCYDILFHLFVGDFEFEIVLNSQTRNKNTALERKKLELSKNITF